jgi:hypothetical protein
MKRMIIAGALASLVAWAGAPAQAQQTQAQDSKGKTITLTGCLAKGDTADSFMLNKATMSGEKATAAGASGEKTGTKDAQGAAYHLTPGKVQKMEAHVGHTVEITGTIDATQSKSGASGTSGTSGAAGSASTSKPAMQHVTVTGMKHVAATCS